MMHTTHPTHHDEVYMTSTAQHYHTLNDNKASIDLRSDTVTLPTTGMREAMSQAAVGDDVYGEDPNINSLEERMAAMAGKPAALYLGSGTQSNLVAMLSHCERGEEVLVGDQYHVFRYEARGASILGGVSLHPLDTSLTGKISPQVMLNAIKENDYHFPITRLLSIENTVHGCVQPLDEMSQLATVAHEAGLKVHMDGARVFNAAIAQNCSLEQLLQTLDSASLCLSKGLGAPVGSILVGESAFIEKARRLRKMLGGGMRQAGILAAAAHYALDHHIERLTEDHQHAQQLAQGLSDIEALTIDHQRLQTNMVFVKAQAPYQALQSHLANCGILISGGNDTWIRLVTHLDISQDDIQHIIKSFQSFYHT